MAQRNSMKMIPALMLVAFSGAVSASGFQLIEQNSSGLGNAYAGSAAVAENASTIFYNPAGMTQLNEREISGGLALVRPSFKFHNQGSVMPAAYPSPPLTSLSGEGGDGGSLAALPNGYVSWALNKDLYVGVGFGAPFGLVTEYDENWLGAAQSVKFDIKTYNVNPSIAYRVNDVVSIGGGLNWQKMEIEYQKKPLAFTAHPVNGAVPLATLSADDTTWGWNIGALFTLSASTKVGVSYRSSVKYTLDGALEVPASAVTGAAVHRPTIADIELPDTFILSVTQKLNERWTMLGDVSWTGWSKIPEVNIKSKATGVAYQVLSTDFKDTWRVALGANYQLNDAWKLKYGIAYDQTPVKDAQHRLLSLPDNDRTWLSFGGQWAPSKSSTVDFGVSYLFVKDASINAVSVDSNNLTNTVSGYSKNNAWIIGAQYSMAF